MEHSLLDITRMWMEPNGRGEAPILTGIDDPKDHISPFAYDDSVFWARGPVATAAVALQVVHTYADFSTLLVDSSDVEERIGTAATKLLTPIRVKTRGQWHVSEGNYYRLSDMLAMEASETGARLKAEEDDTDREEKEADAENYLMYKARLAGIELARKKLNSRKPVDRVEGLQLLLDNQLYRENAAYDFRNTPKLRSEGCCEKGHACDRCLEFALGLTIAAIKALHKTGSLTVARPRAIKHLQVTNESAESYVQQLLASAPELVA